MKNNYVTIVGNLPIRFDLAEALRLGPVIASGNSKPLGIGSLFQAGRINLCWFMPETMRISSATLDVASGTDYYIIYANNTTDGFSDLLIQNYGDKVYALYWGSDISATIGHTCYIRTNDANAHVGIIAEL